MKNGKIQVHYRELDGTVGVINRLSGENTYASDGKGSREALYKRALKMSYDWTAVYPYTQFFVAIV